ncbi:MAG: AAA family ATPase, partial [Muribaculaceae bacterium]|nr:AAA family ATPase [Muribaculaceae bacterium]
MSESFRLLRTKVDFLGVNTKDDGKKGKVIMITSLMAGMGKTFISSNLAASFGMAGKRIIVIDLDLRRGSMLP